MDIYRRAFANEKVLQCISHHLDLNPVAYCRFLQVNKLFKTTFSSDALWKPLDVYGVATMAEVEIANENTEQVDTAETRIYSDFMTRLAGPDEQLVQGYWSGQVRQRQGPTENRYLLIGPYLSCPESVDLVPIIDRDILQCVLKSRPRALKYASDQLKRERPVVMLAVSQRGCAMEFMHPYLGFDRDLVLTALRAGCPRGCCGESMSNYMKNVNSKLLDDEEVVSAAIDVSPDALMFASFRLLQNEQLVLKAVSNSGKLLKIVASYALPSRRIVLSAVKQYGLALEWVPHLNNDRFIVYSAVNQNGMALEYAAPTWQDNHFTVKIAVGNCGRALQFASYRLKNSIGCVRIAVQQDARAIEFVSPTLRDNRAFVHEIIQVKGAVFKYISQRLMRDTELALLAVQQNGRVVQFLGSRHRGNAAIIQAAVRTHPYAITYASRELLDNREFLLESVGINGWVIDQLPGLAEDADMVIKAVESNPSCIVSTKLRFEQEFMLKAIEVNPLTLKYVRHARGNTNNMLRAVNFLAAKERDQEEDLFLRALQEDLEAEEARERRDLGEDV